MASTSTQQGINTQILSNTKKYSNQNYGQMLNLNNNTNYSISPNAVKLLPPIANNNNYVKLYTATNMSISVGDYVYIMYDENQTDPLPSGATLTVLDSYYEFSGCTDWIYLHQEQGYQVLEINETNNEVTIKRFYDTSLDNVKLYNHYLCKIYVNKINFYGGWIDGVCFRQVNLNNSSDTYIDVDIKQCINLSGGTTTGITAYYVDMRDKYDAQYVSVDSDVNNNISKATFSPYKYTTTPIQRTDSPVSSYFSYNNNSFGYTYINYKTFYNSLINNGYYNTCIFSGGTITGGYFNNCNFYDVLVQSGNFTNCNINANSVWYYGTWSGSGTTCFGPNIWYNGIWNEGIFSGKTWVTGIFNGGIFEDSYWYAGIFNGGYSIFNPSNDENFIRSYWSGGTFNNGGITLSVWNKGVFNNGVFDQSIWFSGIFNNGMFQSSFWSGGTFNNGTFYSSNWTSGNFNGGNFTYSTWYYGTFNNGIFNTGVITGDTILNNGLTYKWINGIFNGGKFTNSFWSKGDFYSGQMIGSVWSGGTFHYGDFNNSVWLYGDWLNGIANNSIYHRVNWLQGTFNSGTMGKEMHITDPVKFDVPMVYWSGGTFNSGVFGNQLAVTGNTTNNETSTRCTSSPSRIFWYGGDFYGGKFYSNYSTYCIPNPLNKTFAIAKNSGGFLDGVFHEGYFYSVYLGGHWMNGLFHNKSYNWTDQIIPTATKYNYYVNDSGNNSNSESG